MPTSTVTGSATVTSSTSTEYTVAGGGTLYVAAGGVISGAQVQSSGSLVVDGGVDSGATVSAGGTETVATGSAVGDLVYGTLSNVSGVAGVLTNEVIGSGGKFYETNSAVVTGAEVLSGGSMFVSGNTSGTNSNTVLSGGGFLELESAKATLGGTLTFEGGNNVLEVSATVSAGYADQAVIVGFSTTDKIDVRTVALSTPTFTVSGGNTIVTVGGSEKFIFSGTTTYTSNTIVAVTDGAGGEYLEYVPSSSGTSFTVNSGQTSTGLTVSAGETLIVQSGGTISSTNIQSGGQAVVSGTDVSATVAAGGTLTVSGSASADLIYGSAVVEGAASGETVENGGALFVSSGATDSGSTMLSGGTETVAGGAATGGLIYGVLSTVSGDAGTLTSETVYKGGAISVANGNDAIGTTISSGGLLAISGAGSATGVTTLSGGGELALQSPKAAISGSIVFAGGGNTLDVTAVASSGYGDQAKISGFSTTDTIDVNAGISGATLSVTSNSDGSETATLTGTSAGSAVSESFIFANAATYNGYTLTSQGDGSGGVDIGYNPNQTVLVVSGGQTSTGLSATSGETISVLAGGTVSSTLVNSGGALVVSGNDVSATVSGTEAVYGSATADKVYGVADVSGSGARASAEVVQSGGSLSIFGGANLAATVSAGGSVTVTNSGTTSGDQIYGSVAINGASATGETVDAGGALAIVGGVNTSATISVGGSETVTNSGATSFDKIYGGLTISGAGTSATSETVEAGGSMTVNSGGVDGGTTVLAGGNELVIGSASGDQIYGTQLVSNATAVVTSETVFAGGAIDNFLKGGIASGTVVSSGGALNISGFAYASNTVLSGGGVLSLQSPKAEATGTLVFAGGGNTLDITGTTSANYGDLALNIGFSATDKIDITSSAFVGSALTLSQTTSGGNTVADVISGGTTVEAFTFSGASLDGDLSLETDGNGGVFLEETPLPVTTSVTTSTGSGVYTETAGNTLLVLSGGSVSAPTIDNGAFLVVDGGSDSGATIVSGGLETVSAGNASDDNILGSAVVSGGSVVNETVQSGGALTIDGGFASNTVLDGGATVDLATPTATLTGTIAFSGGDNTLEAGAVASAGDGDQATISGFSTSDKIDVAFISSSGASLTFAPGANGAEVATVSGTGGSESFIFANGSTYNANTMALAPDGAGVDLVLKTTPVVAFTSLNGLSTNDATQIVNGIVDVSTDPEAIGTTVTIDEGGSAIGTGVVGSNGYWSAKVVLTNSDGANTITASDTDKAGQTGTTSQSLTYNVDTAAAAFTPGDLVVSLSGDSDGSGNYGDNQASPLTLEEFTTTGTLVSQIVLPQTTTVVNGKTEYAISDEYGSSSEGTLELSGDGHSLVIAGYGVNADTFNAGGAAVYGTAALAQSTSVPGGPYTVVPRVIADINADGVIDTSTALTDIYNTNNPRSVATINGSAFWISGQGVKGDTTQGVFYATDGASTATAINTATDTRTVEIYDGQLYVSADSTQGATNISDYGALPTSATTPTVLPGINESVTLTATNGNGVNSSDIGQSVYLSPENYFFANDDTLYVADGGDPKNGGLGDGGLQKWEFNGSTWTLEYTLSAGLNLVPDTSAHGTSGLIGLTGEVVNGNVELFATNETLSDLDPTYVYEITDSLSSTTGADESFSEIMAATPGENIRGISFAPTAYAPTITGTVGGQTTVNQTPDTPFSGVAIADANANADDMLTITIGGVGGTLADGNGFNGLVDDGSGVYALAGTAGAITNEIDALQFTPATLGESTFALSDLSSADSTPTTDTTTTVTSVPCFARGTRILTGRGEVAVEHLEIGDLVVTASGDTRPITWIGRRALSCAAHPDPESVWPYRVAADAFGEGLPVRDLWLSPGHNVAVEGVLIPVRALANGVSVARREIDRVEYWHVELDQHDVLLADGLPAESYLDTGNRTAFIGGDAFIEAHPDFEPRHWAQTCLPLVKQGPEVVRARRALLERIAEAGHSLTTESDLHVLADGRRIEPIAMGKNRFVFLPPPESTELQLVSRAFVPGQISADDEDYRVLGVCVARLQIDRDEVGLGREDAVGVGWHAPEREGRFFTRRWTQGVAPLPSGARFIMVDIASPGHYWSDVEPARPRSAPGSSAVHGARASRPTTSVA